MLGMMSWRSMLTPSIWPYSTAAAYVLNSLQPNMLWNNTSHLSISSRPDPFEIYSDLVCSFQWLWKLPKRSRLWVNKSGKRLKWVASPGTGLVASVATVITGRKWFINMLIQNTWRWFIVVITAISLRQLNTPSKSTWGPTTKICLSFLPTPYTKRRMLSFWSEIN